MNTVSKTALKQFREHWPDIVNGTPIAVTRHGVVKGVLMPEGDVAKHGLEPPPVSMLRKEFAEERFACDCVWLTYGYERIAYFPLSMLPDDYQMKEVHR